MMVYNLIRFTKKNFGHFKSKNRARNYNSEKPRDESFKISQTDEDKQEKKLLGDSGYECNYCHGKNHFAKECILRRISEKKEEEKDEYYYLQKIENLRKKTSTDNVKPALIVPEEVDEFGHVEVWSTDSEDEEVQKPLHGRCFVVKSGVPEYEGRGAF